ncbi:MAG: hypothetical protein KJ069_26015 [Anaerolineae bacterium]|nr:hypothetical protein [Anaerolineae bacterium]
MRLSQQQINNLPVDIQGERGELPSYKTKVIESSQGQKQVVFHQTAVVSFDQETITLNTGGWWTRTTKVRMNQASATFGLGFRVFQKAGEWFVDFQGDAQPFSNDRLELKWKPKEDREDLHKANGEGVSVNA